MRHPVAKKVFVLPTYGFLNTWPTKVVFEVLKTMEHLKFYKIFVKFNYKIKHYSFVFIFIFLLHSILKITHISHLKF